LEVPDSEQLKYPPYIKKAYRIRSDYDIVKYLANSINSKVIILDYVVVRDGEFVDSHSVEERIKDGEYVIRTLDRLRKVEYSPEKLIYDGEHLTEKGCELLAEIVAEYLIQKDLVKLSQSNKI
jgi:hypothetical protein